MTNTYWLIEAPGPYWLIESKGLFWSDDYNAALRFYNEKQAKVMLRAIRAFKPELFAQPWQISACPTEHKEPQE